MALHSLAYQFSHSPARLEAECEQAVLGIFDAESLRAPYRLLKMVLMQLIWCAQRDQAAGYEPDAFVENVIDQFLFRIRKI